MAAAAVLEPAAEWGQLQAALSKKTSFESTCQLLCSRPQALSEPGGRALLARCRVLLRSRYTTRPFFAAGRRLFQAAAEAAAGSGDQAFQQQLLEAIGECNAFLGEEPEAETSGSGGGGAAATDVSGAAGGATRTSSRDGYLFEGQMSSGQSQPPPRQPDLMDLLGEALGRQLAAAQAAAAAAAAQQQQGAGGEQPLLSQREAGSEAGDVNAQEEPQQAADGGAAPPPGELPQPPPDVLAAIERELDAIAVQIMEETGQQVQRGAPPASKKVVAALPKERLSEERLRELGGTEVRCPVCMEDFAVGDEVQALPCKHVYHPPCVAPWLEDNNSCPTCRHELPTDDQQYERRKEREQAEAEERRGAENANSHSEFLYI